jgi:hypothetical protein
MSEDPAVKIRRHLRSGVLVDTNLLLVYFVGLYDNVSGYQLINSFRYTKGTYDTGDFEVLSNLLGRFDKQIITPHILTEVGNSLGQLTGPAKEACFELLKRIVPSLEERTVGSRELCEDDAFNELGVAETSIVKVTTEPCLVLTDDFHLSGYLDKIGVDAVNFRHIKLLL